MDLGQYGLGKVEDVIATNTLTLRGAKAWGNWLQDLDGFGNITATNTFVFELSANGLVVKPSTVTGKRRAQGQIQEALGDFLLAYGTYTRLLAEYDYAYDQFKYEVNMVRELSILNYAFKTYQEVKFGVEMYKAASDAAVKCAIHALEWAYKSTDAIQHNLIASSPHIIGAGMTVNSDPSALVSAATGTAVLTAQETIGSSIVASKSELDGTDAVQNYLDIAEEAASVVIGLAEDLDSYYDRLRDAAGAHYEAACAVKTAWKELLIAQARVETVIAEAERILDERVLVRQQAVDTLTKARYNEMFFRLDRNEALSRYETAFELAQKYVYLAAQAYASVGFTTFTITPEPFSAIVVLTLKLPVSPLKARRYFEK